MNFRMSKIFLAVFFAVPLYSAEAIPAGKTINVSSLGFTTVNPKATQETFRRKDPKFFECVRSMTPTGRLMIADMSMNVSDVIISAGDIKPDNTVMVGDTKTVSGFVYTCVALAEIESSPEESRNFAPLFFKGRPSYEKTENRDLCFYDSSAGMMKPLRLSDEG